MARELAPSILPEPETDVAFQIVDLTRTPLRRRSRCDYHPEERCIAAGCQNMSRSSRYQLCSLSDCLCRSGYANAITKRDFGNIRAQNVEAPANLSGVRCQKGRSFAVDDPVTLSLATALYTTARSTVIDPCGDVAACVVEKAQ